MVIFHIAGIYVATVRNPNKGPNQCAGFLVSGRTRNEVIHKAISNIIMASVNAL